ncbi:MAG: antitoxin [Ilumatobacteraceae bacterium]
MRTTLDLDDDVLEAARELARGQRRSIGHVISSLARAGLRPASVELIDGLPVIGARGQLITSEMVRRAVDDE